MTARTAHLKLLRLVAVIVTTGILCLYVGPAESADSAAVQMPRPQYRMSVRLNPAARSVVVRQLVTWTNPGTEPTGELIFQVVPNNRPSETTLEVGRRTVESLRLDPRDCIDEVGRRFHLRHVRIADPDGTPGEALVTQFSPAEDTQMRVVLPEPVAPGESVTVLMDYAEDLPPVMGRFGQFEGVTNLLNWYPVLAVYRGSQWLPVPYIPWHQPWFNEAGDYSVQLLLPSHLKVVTGGRVVAEEMLGSSERRLQIEGRGLRDFTIIAAHHLAEWKSEVDGIPVRVLALPHHEHHARVALRTAEECLRTYAEWFGPYPYDEFELTESYFGWNGNESSGVVMIDHRIMDLPKYAERYVEHLISHEICHQWWYSAVGTDGYHEPWMDEGLVQWLTRVRMEDKYGADPELLSLPGAGPFRFPNVSYRGLLHSGYRSYRSRGGKGASLSSLDEIGHLHNLFSLVYDRGARIVGMIQNRMGRERFFQFLRHVYGKYRFSILTAADFRAELESFTGEDWGPFFEEWLAGDGETDWAVEDVSTRDLPHGRVLTEARVRNHGALREPVRVGVRTRDAGRPFRLATLSQARQAQQDSGDITIRQQGPGDWLVQVVSDDAADEIVIDPDQVLIESDVSNNGWGRPVRVRWSPFYTPADEAPLLQPFRQSSIVAGFGVDPDGRFGLRASLLDGARFRVSPFLAYTAATARSNDDHLSAGIDAAWYDLPGENWQLLARYEHALLSTLANDPGHQGRVALRKVLQYTSSLIYPNLSYIDVYARFGDNFFPDEDATPSLDPRAESFDDVRAFGVEFHLDSQMPYWNPERGYRVDAGYEHGTEAFGGGAGYNRVHGQVAGVRRLGFGPEWLQETRLAGRIAGGYGWNSNGEHFRFGGPGRFRGRDANDTEGNAFALATAEWRFPLLQELDMRVADNTAALSGVDGALFYEVGQSWLFDSRQGPVDHAVGTGLYFNIPLLSFVEHLTVRTEYGYSLTNQSGVFWFGLYRAF